MELSELMVEAEDSGGLPRMAGPAKDFVKGSINKRPFRPGGLDSSQASERIPVGASNGQWVWEVINGGPPQTIPPSFKQGLDLGDLKANLSISSQQIFVITFLYLGTLYDGFPSLKF